MENTALEAADSQQSPPKRHKLMRNLKLKEGIARAR
jgi:hypothetical protein